MRGLELTGEGDDCVGGVSGSGEEGEGEGGTYSVAPIPHRRCQSRLVRGAVRRHQRGAHARDTTSENRGVCRIRRGGTSRPTPRRWCSSDLRPRPRGSVAATATESRCIPRMKRIGAFLLYRGCAHPYRFNPRRRDISRCGRAVG